MQLCDLFFEEGGLTNGSEEQTARGADDGKGLVFRAYSSDLPVSERKTVLEMFKSQKVHMYVPFPEFSFSH